MDTVIARPTVETTETQEPREVNTKVDQGPAVSKEVPLEIYKQENKTPYIDKLLETDDLLPTETRDSIKSIDDYITALMDSKGYSPTTEAYRATLDGLKKDLGIDKNTSLESTIERLSKYIEAEGMLKSLKDIDEEKILRQLRKSPTQSLIALVMKQVEKKGL